MNDNYHREHEKLIAENALLRKHYHDIEVQTVKKDILRLKAGRRNMMKLKPEFRAGLNGGIALLNEYLRRLKKKGW